MEDLSSSSEDEVISESDELDPNDPEEKMEVLMEHLRESLSRKEFHKLTMTDCTNGTNMRSGLQFDVSRVVRTVNEGKIEVSPLKCRFKY